MKRIFLSAALPILAIAALTLPAEAIIWCRADPVVRLDGTLADITISVPLEYTSMVNGPLHFEIQTPKSTSRQVVVSDAGYNLHGSEVIFTDGGGVTKDKQIPTGISVRVPIDESRLAPGEVVPVELTVIPENGEPVSVYGTSDHTNVDLSILGH